MAIISPLFSTPSASVFWLTTCIKLLLIPFYHSTDFDVHRNWLAITSSLPPSEWYYEATSQWTLDYPPFFAWFEFVLARAAPLFDAQMLVISAAPYASPATVLFQRLTVIISDLVLFFALRHFASSPSLAPSSPSTSSSSLLRVAPLLFGFANPSLLLVDHLHFQYNGFLLGVFVLSISYTMRGRFLLGAALFAALLNLKHIFLYVAAVYFVYLLRVYCFDEEMPSFRGWSQYHARMANVKRRFNVRNFVQLGLVVIVVFAISLGPFIMHLPQVFARLFPVKRGLCHAYWAPNLWALYTFVDTGLVAVIRRVGGVDLRASMTAGLVADHAHVLLPKIHIHTTLLLTLFTWAPALRNLWRAPHPRVFLSTLIYCTFASFMLGWHVHEKAILMVLVPLSLCALDDALASRTFLFLSTVSCYSLFPLLFRPTETPIKGILLCLHVAICYHIMDTHREQRAKHRRLLVRSILSRAESLYLWGLGALQLFTSVIHPLVCPHLEFLPLMLTSVYCSLGMAYAWYLTYRMHRRSVMDILEGAAQ